jgi:hypothetical protein
MQSFSSFLSAPYIGKAAGVAYAMLDRAGEFGYLGFLTQGMIHD